jgi:multidrug transporter EmrE-like cation transporter
MNVITMSLFMYDFIAYRAKKHKIYFITLEEYKPFGKTVATQYIIKSITYAVLFAIGLIMLIITGVSFFK